MVSQSDIMNAIENLKTDFEQEHGVKPSKVIFNKDAVELIWNTFTSEKGKNLEGRVICELTIAIYENAKETFTVCNENVAPKVEEALRLPRL